jgi:adenosine/AMP deaminase-like protein
MPSSSRLAGIPLDHVVAEIAAFPLASEAALELGLTELAPELVDPTGRLWRHAEAHLMRTFPSFSLDEMVAVRDRIWFAGSRRTPVPLHAYLRQLAGCFLEVNGTAALPRLSFEDRLPGPGQEAHTAIARRCWLWLGLALPSDLLLAALDRNGSGPHRIDLLSPVVAQQLRERGYAETHLHVGAALDFTLLWNAALYALSLPSLSGEAFESPGAGLSEGADLAPWMVRTALARYVLAAYLAAHPTPRTLFGFLHTDFYRDVAPEIGAAGFARLVLALSELVSGRMQHSSLGFANLRTLYAQLTRVAEAPIPLDLAVARGSDPISELVPGDPRQSPECRLVARGLNYLEGHGGGTPHHGEFGALFWQTVRIRALFYRHVVQRPMTPGLHWFVRFYDRTWRLRKALTLDHMLESAAAPGGLQEGLRSLEVRLSPDRSVAKLQDDVRRVGNAAARWRPPRAGEGGRADRPSIEVGLVLHFIRNRAGGVTAGRPKAFWSGTHAEPRISPDETSGNPSGYRYARFYRDQRTQADALSWLLTHRPLTLEVVRGIDVCTDELGVPHWVLVPVMRQVRQAAGAGARALRRLRGWTVPPLRTTIHAGEDFVHLLTGLRLVDQAIEQLGLREGDRIGHGLALGLDPREWARRACRVAMSREERLMDLVWEWSWYGQQGGGTGTTRQTVLLYELAHLTDHVFGRAVSPYDLSLLVRDLCDPHVMYDVGFPDGPPPPPPASGVVTRRGRLRDYLCDQGVFERGREIVWVDAGSEGEALAGLQAALRQKLGARGIAVEVNPTSNLLVGDLEDLSAHPLWRLRPPRGGGDAPPVSVCIGSDDPVVFASNLRHEYQLLSDALALAGLSDEEARTWLDRTRDCGLEGRFTQPFRHEVLDLPLDEWRRGWETRFTGVPRTEDWILSLFNTDDVPAVLF